MPQWRFTPDGDRGDADRLVLDLDPGPGVGLAECAEVARWAREILGHMGLEPFPVTSGSKGIQLYSALPPGQTSEAASAIAHELARAIEADHPDLVVSSMKKAIRDGRVLIDWSQNNGVQDDDRPVLAARARASRTSPRRARGRSWTTRTSRSCRSRRCSSAPRRSATRCRPSAIHAGGRDRRRRPAQHVHRQAHRGQDARACAVRSRRGRARPPASCRSS